MKSKLINLFNAFFRGSDMAKAALEYCADKDAEIALIKKWKQEQEEGDAAYLRKLKLTIGQLELEIERLKRGKND